MSIGPWQIALIVVLALVIFGAGRLPSMMRDLARGMRVFKDTLLDSDREDGDDGKDHKTSTLTQRQAPIKKASRKAPVKKAPGRTAPSQKASRQASSQKAPVKKASTRQAPGQRTPRHSSKKR